MKGLSLILFCLIINFNILAVEFRVPSFAYDLDLADIDLDGDLDIIVASQVSDEDDIVSILINNG